LVVRSEIESPREAAADIALLLERRGWLAPQPAVAAT
jgi:hypothetical protein